MEQKYMKSDIDLLGDKSRIDGCLYLQDYDIQQSKGNKPFVKGSFYGRGILPFKCWNSSKAFAALQMTNMRGQVVHVTGEVNIFNDNKSLIIDNVIPSVSGYSYLDFLDVVYDEDQCWNTLLRVLTSHCSQAGLQVFQLIMADPRVQNFRTEFAAISHHDACRGGLLAHTMKVVCHMANVMDWYPGILQKSDKDVLLIGAALHDIGKCVEYYRGTMSEQGLSVSHTMLGGIVVSSYEQQIRQLKGDAFYYALLSVIQQHHGPYGERPRSLAAYLVHLVDNLDAGLTDIETQMRLDIQGAVQASVSVRDIGRLHY